MHLPSQAVEKSFQLTRNTDSRCITDRIRSTGWMFKMATFLLAQPWLAKPRRVPGRTQRAKQVEVEIKVELPRLLQSQPWPEPKPFNIRLGLRGSSCFNRGESPVQVGMAEPMAELCEHLVAENSLPWILRGSLPRADDSPPPGYFGANVHPATRLAITHIVRLSRATRFQRKNAEVRQVFDMNQVDELVGRADQPLPDPVHGIAVRAVNTRHTQNGGSMPDARIFFALNTAKAGIDGSRFIEPWRESVRRSAIEFIGGCAA